MVQLYKDPTYYKYQIQLHPFSIHRYEELLR
jgi:hypothetical protein